MKAFIWFLCAIIGMGLAFCGGMKVAEASAWNWATYTVKAELDAGSECKAELVRLKHIMAEHENKKKASAGIVEKLVRRYHDEISDNESKR